MGDNPLEGVFKYYQVSVSAQKLPGFGRLDPVIVAYTGGSGHNVEIGRTRPLKNQWNPSFPEVFYFPCDSPAQQSADIRIDFYNKSVSQDRFFGTAKCQLAHIIQNEGRPLELPFTVAETGAFHPQARVVLKAALCYNKPTDEARAGVKIGLEMEQTNYFGVSKKVYFEVSRSDGGSTWTPVLTSPTADVDPQGWCQFKPVSSDLMQLAMGEASTPLLISIYRYRPLGRGKRLLGHFQTNLKALERTDAGTLLQFTGNGREDLLAANVRVENVSVQGNAYDVVFKLVNVRWKADEIPPPAPE